MRLSYLLVLLSLNAAAQTDRAERSDVRELRRGGLLAAQETAERDRRPVDYRLLLGVAYTDAESGEERWVTPFEYRVRFNEHKTYVKLSGDGYVDSRSAEGHATGLANVNVGVTHQLAAGLRGTLGVTVPTGGEVGSKQGRERVGLSYEHDLWERWTGLIKVQLVRYDADPDPGESRVRRQGLAQIAYTFDANTLALAQLERFYRPGVLSASAASVGYQMPVGRTAGGPLLGVVTLSRGLSAGLHDTTLELDVCMRF
jgi:hypothetical protein